MIKRYNKAGTTRAYAEIDTFGNLRVQRQTYIDPELIAHCRELYERSKTKPTKEGDPYWLIPDNLFYEWLAEGFDPMQESPSEVAKRLRMEGLDALICNAKI